MHKMFDLKLVRQNLRLVKQVYPHLPKAHLRSLRELTRTLVGIPGDGDRQFRAIVIAIPG